MARQKADTRSEAVYVHLLPMPPHAVDLALFLEDWWKLRLIPLWKLPNAIGDHDTSVRFNMKAIILSFETVCYGAALPLDRFLIS